MPGRNERTPSGRRDAVRKWIGEFLTAARRDFARDLDEGRGFLWWPVAIGLGEAVYFLLPVEPSRIDVAVLLLAASALAFRIRKARVHLAFPAALVVLAAVGFALAKVSVEVNAAPRLARERTHVVSGVVEAVEDRGGSGARILLRPAVMEPPPPDGLPERLRIVLRSAVAPLPGEGLTMTARLTPPTGPLIPGGYDFSRAAYFAGIGGVGFALGRPRPWAEAPEPEGWVSIGIAIERFRQAVSRHIRQTLPGDTGAIAAALIVGDRGAIDPDTDKAMRISGLSHVLSISGLHMALVAGFLFGAVRAGLALVPPLALRLPSKKIAAVVALAGTGAYFVVSGMAVPSERSAIMIGTTLVAVLLDRRALSLRVVAVAALIALAVQPAAVLDPGAQMSFAAVVGLVAGFEAMADRLRPRDGGDINIVVRAIERTFRWVGLSLLTSLIAGLATAPIALHHFNRIAPLGLLSNLAATPLVSFVIMPAAVTSAFLMPVALDEWPLRVMGEGIEGMVAIAEVVAAWTPAGGAFGAPRLAGTLLVVSGGLWLALWRGRQRWLGLPALLLGLVLVPAPAGFDLVVAGDGRGALLSRPDGTLVVVGKPGDFELSLWLAARGDSRGPQDPSLAAGSSCDREACVVWEDRRRGMARAAAVFAPVAFSDECTGARLVITPLAAPPWCRSATTVIDRTDLADSGARTYRVTETSDNDPLVLRPVGRAIPEGRRPWTGF